MKNWNMLLGAWILLSFTFAWLTAPEKRTQQIVSLARWHDYDAIVWATACVSTGLWIAAGLYLVFWY